MSNEVVVYENKTIIHNMDDALKAASAMSGSGFFKDTMQASQAVVKILAGQELGFGPFASMTGVHIIQGKPTIGANLMAAAVKSRGKYNYRVMSMTEQGCSIDFYEGKEKVGTSTFTIEDAKKAELTGKDTWKKYAKNLLFARAMSNGCRWFCPDIFNGAPVYTPEELGADVDGEGNVINVTPTEPMKAPESKSTSPSDAPGSLETTGLIERSGKKDTKTGGTRYSFLIDNVWFSTFDKNVAEQAKAAQEINAPVKITYKTGKFGNDIEALVLHEEETEKVDADNPI